jgi:hypothetical protein
MVLSLNKTEPSSTFTALDNPNNIIITPEELNLLMKEFVFEKLKGRSLADFLCEKLNVNDFVLHIQVTDEWALDYITTHYVR